ncbi:ribonuclease [Erwinia typographi]|uniref:Ribonuclease n=1 Tax=Erwinia typographi TaxID=371042 RepID=A0A0A3YTX1_9GAMM|nr:ribonuclease domain-containing protein [Erwinia typographi]KGT88816.1 ribonuclease [Erwinia typographi]
MNKKLIVAVILAIVATAAGLRHPANNPPAQQQTAPTSSTAANDISSLTQLQRVASYLHQHQRLPAWYLTKSEARRQGWEPGKGNLCQILPGRAIGGDRFSNREKVLPEKQGRRWFEADVNYDCGRRGSDRMLYSSDGLIYVTSDHYRNVKQVY